MTNVSLPLISIVTPSFNSGEFLEQALRSVAGQDYPYIEHIVIDGGSTDGTLEILRRYQPGVTWISEPDNGQANALNKGFAMARGDIVGWLNADDTYQPGALTAAAAYLQAHPTVDLVYGNFNLVDAAGHILHTHTTPPFSLAGLLQAAIIPQTSMFFRRVVIDDVGGVDEKLHYVLDWEFTLRIALTHQTVRIGEVWGNFRLAEGTKSVAQPEKFWPETARVLEKLDNAVDQVELKDACFMAHLLAGLEFARVGAVELARTYMVKAFGLGRTRHAAELASTLSQTAFRPWYSGFREHPQAETALDNLSGVLAKIPAARQVCLYLHLYRSLRYSRRAQWPLAYKHWSIAKQNLKPREFLDWRVARMSLGSILRS